MPLPLPPPRAHVPVRCPFSFFLCVPLMCHQLASVEPLYAKKREAESAAAAAALADGGARVRVACGAPAHADTPTRF